MSIYVFLDYYHLAYYFLVCFIISCYYTRLNLNMLKVMLLSKARVYKFV